MKRIKVFLSAMLIIIIEVSAQSPDKFKYQAIIRNTDGTIRANQNVNVQIGILQGSLTGTLIYLETHSVNANSMGIVNLAIGDGIVDSGSLSGIDWSVGPFFLKIRVDSSEMGTSQILSVPYAKYAEKAGNGFSGHYSDLIGQPNLADTSKYIRTETDPVFNNSIAKGITSSDTANWNKIIYKKGMGDWEDGLLTETIYFAKSDGFLYGVSTVPYNNRCTSHIAHILIGTSSSVLVDIYQAEYDMHFLIPVKKQTYYKIHIPTANDCNIPNATISLKWMPLY
jgi:hypothetical protein